MLIVALLFCYVFVINLVRNPGKAETRKLYPDTIDFAVFVGSCLSYTGLLAISFVIVRSNLLEGWVGFLQLLLLRL